MVTNELDEWQFKLIKEMCKQHVYVIFGPHNQPNDSEVVRNGYIKNLTALHDMVKQGFMTNVTGEFSDVLNEARTKGMRTFDAFKLTQNGIQMFDPPEGLVN